MKKCSVINISSVASCGSVASSSPPALTSFSDYQTVQDPGMQGRAPGKTCIDREHDAEQCVNSGNENCCKQDPVSNVVKSRFADIVGRNLVADTVFRPV